MPQLHASAPRLVIMPAKLRLAADVVKHLAEAVVVPLGLFYAIVVSFGLDSALLAALGWAFLAVLARLVRGSRPPVLLLAATGMATIQVAVAFAANSATVYFLQPTVATYVFGAALLVTLPSERPLIQRLAHDFCPLPEDVVGNRHLRRFFQRLSALWGVVLLVNASLTLGLLLTLSTSWSVPLAAVGSLPVFAAGLVLSYVWFRHSLRAGGFHLTWG